jgi:hypothetical protein
VENSFNAAFSRKVDVACRLFVTANMTIRRAAAEPGFNNNLYNQTFLMYEAYMDEYDTNFIYYNYDRRRDINISDLLEGQLDKLEDWWDEWDEDHPEDWDEYPEEWDDWSIFEDDWSWLIGKETAVDVEPGHIMLLSYPKTMPGGGVNEDAWNIEIPGGFFIIDYEFFYEVLEDFIEELSAKTETYINCVAEVAVDFTYRIYVKDYQLDESITRGFMFPVRKDVYSFTATGTQTKEASSRLDSRSLVFEDIEDDVIPQIAFLFAAVLLFPVFVLGFLRCIGIRFKRKKKTFDYLVDRIVKKYANEIIPVSTPIENKEYKINALPNFQELLKLSLYTSNPIFCFRDTDKAEFTVTYEKYIHRFCMVREEGLSE